MIVRVYFECGGCADIAAIFNSEELYSACLPILEKYASKHNLTVTESIDEFVDIDDVFEHLEK